MTMYLKRNKRYLSITNKVMRHFILSLLWMASQRKNSFSAWFNELFPPQCYLSDGGDFLVLSVWADRIGSLQEGQVFMPDGERVEVHADLVQRKVVRLRHLLPGRGDEGRVKNVITRLSGAEGTNKYLKITLSQENNGTNKAIHTVQIIVSMAHGESKGGRSKDEARRSDYSVNDADRYSKSHE